MLAGAPPPLPPGMTTTRILQHRSSSFNMNMIHMNRVNWTCWHKGSGTMKLPKNNSTRNTRIRVTTAGHTWSPMETPGSSRVVDIDHDTGETFILCGENHSPIPSKDILSRKPKLKSGSPDSSSNDFNYTTATAAPSCTPSSRGINPATPDGRNFDYGKARDKRFPGSFGKLKIQRTKTRVRRTSDTEQEMNSKDPSNQFVGDTSTDCDFVGGNGKETASRHEGSSSVSTKSLTSRNPDPGMKLDRADISASRGSTGRLRGWGNVEVEPTHKNEFTKLHHLKQQKIPSFDIEFFSQKTFEELGCNDDMIAFLKGQLFFRPSHIQAMAFAPVIEGKSCVIADQSGSGKTLAYLIPLIQRLRQEELQGISKSFSKSPRTVILVPTAELASQVFSDCRSISKFGFPFRSMVATGGFRQKTQLENLQLDIDVLVATPGRLMSLIKDGALQFANLRCAVLDEVDVLFKDEDFEPALLQLIHSAPINTQYLFVTATLPIEVYNKLVEIFPDCKVVAGPGVHRISPRLEEVLVDCSGDGAEKTAATAFTNKKSALLRLVEENPVPRTIIFCNKIETCRKVENVLKRYDRKGTSMQVLPFHAALAPEYRAANMKEFLDSHSEDSMVLVSTDRASKGIDFAGVDHVVLFDFPRDPSEYVRRVGRTARGANGKGKAFIFSVGKQVSLARRILGRNQKGHPVHDVPFLMS